METKLFLLLIGITMFSCGTTKKSYQTQDLSYWKNTTQVKILSGWVEGTKEKNCYSFKGIPYAAPPIKTNRWKAPRPHPGWDGLYQAKHFRGMSPQFLPFFGWIVGDEDCLYLNLWRPISIETNLPVYVWIHGGGNAIGSAHYVPDYYGATLAEDGNLIFISINYRLGPFGWFTHPALRNSSDPLNNSGNYGTLDILFALEWIQSNIVAFGGDPSRVTIAGESAGGLNVLSLLISPKAKGMFHRAVIQSGYTAIFSREQADKQASTLIAKLLVKKRRASSLPQAYEKLSSLSSEEIQDFLYNLSASEILSVMRKGLLGMSGEINPIADGEILPKEGFSLLEKGNFHAVPLIIGSNKEETKLFLSFSRKDWHSPFYQAVGLFGGLRWKALYVDHLATTMSPYTSVYVYRFDWGAPNEKGESPLGEKEGKRLGAFHTLEIPFWFGNNTIQGFFLTDRVFTKKNEKGRKALSKAMREYLKSFVHTGVPEARSFPIWYPWQTKKDHLGLVFDATLTEPKIEYQTNVVCLDYVYDLIKTSLSPELQAEVKNFLGLTNEF